MINTQNITVHGVYAEDSDHPESATIENVGFIDELRKQLPANAQHIKYPASEFKGDVTFFDYDGDEVELYVYDDNWWLGGFEVHHAKVVLIYWAKHNDTEMRVESE